MQEKSRTVPFILICLVFFFFDVVGYKMEDSYDCLVFDHIINNKYIFRVKIKMKIILKVMVIMMMTHLHNLITQIIKNPGEGEENIK